MNYVPWWMSEISKHPYYTEGSYNDGTYYGFGGEPFIPNRRAIEAKSQVVRPDPETGMLTRGLSPQQLESIGGDDGAPLGSQDFYSSFGMEQPTVDTWGEFGQAIAPAAKYAGMSMIGMDPAGAMFNDATGAMVGDVMGGLSPEQQQMAQVGMLGYGLATNPVATGIGLVANEYGAYDPSKGRGLTEYGISNLGMYAVNPVLGVAKTAYDYLTAPSWESKSVDDWTPEEFNSWYNSTLDPNDLASPPNITGYYQDSSGGWNEDGYSSMEAEGGFYGTDDNYGLADSGPSDFGGSDSDGGGGDDGGWGGSEGSFGGDASTGAGWG